VSGFAAEELGVESAVRRRELRIDENTTLCDCFQRSGAFVWKAESNKQLTCTQTQGHFKSTAKHRYGPTVQIKLSSETVYSACMTSLTVRSVSEACVRLELPLH